MDRNEIMKMLKNEVESKVDSATLEKLKTAKSKDEALSILQGASVELDDEMLSAVAGGDEVTDGDFWCADCSDNHCSNDHCPWFIM